MNYFAPKSSAERYAKGRPYFHRNTIDRIKDYLKINSSLNKALDVACGTGLSSKALLSVAKEVYATDVSEEMLSHAPHKDKINYSVAPAEQQPFPDDYFDLITVSSGVHWFNIDEFLEEMNRLLKSKAWLVVYENYFLSEMDGNEKFTRWYPEVFLKKFPATPRNDKYDWTNANLNSKNLNLMTEDTFKNPVTLNKKQLISYLTSQSNIIASVESRKSTYADAEEFLSNELSFFFDTDESLKTFYFGNWIKYLQKIS